MNKQDELWEQQDKLIGDIDFILRAFQEETPIYNVVTDNYPAIESFIGNSALEMPVISCTEKMMRSFSHSSFLIIKRFIRI